MQSRSGDTYWRDLDKPGGTDLAAPQTAGSAGLYQLPTAEQELHAASSVAAVSPDNAADAALCAAGKGTQAGAQEPNRGADGGTRFRWEFSL